LKRAWKHGMCRLKFARSCSLIACISTPFRPLVKAEVSLVDCATLYDSRFYAGCVEKEILTYGTNVILSPVLHNRNVCDTSPLDDKRKLRHKPSLERKLDFPPVCVRACV
jgi:hypothetical protein